MRSPALDANRIGELALIACAVLLPLAFFFRTYDSSAVKLAVLHWGAIALATAWLWQGLSSGRFTVSAASWPALLPALLYGAWAAASFAASEHKLAALPYALNDAAMLAAYLAAFVGFAGARFAARFASFTVLTGWLVVLYALLQSAGVDPLVWKDAWGERRAFSTLANPEYCAVFLALLPPLALSVIQDPESPREMRAASYLLLPLAAVACVLTRAPWGVLSFVAVSTAYGLLAPLTLGARSALRASVVALVLAASVGGAAALLGQFRGGEFARDWGMHRATASGALRMAGQRPLLGAGPGAFGYAYPNFRSPEDIRSYGKHNTFFARPISSFLGALAQTGAVGAILWLWLFGAALWRGLTGASALRRAGAVAESTYAAGFSAAAAGALLAAQFCEGWQSAAPGWLLWTLAGLGAGLSVLAAKRAPVSAYPFPVSEDVRRALHVPALLAAAALAAPPGAWLKSEVDFNKGVFFAKEGQFDEAVAHWDRVAPGAATYVSSLYFRGNARLDQDRAEDALAFYDRLRATAPDYVLVHAQRGAALAKLGRWEEAAVARARQAELDPVYVPNLVAWAEAARASGDLEQARRAVELAQAESPDDASVKTQVAANALYERRLVADEARRKALERRGTARRP